MGGKTRYSIESGLTRLVLKEEIELGTIDAFRRWLDQEGITPVRIELYREGIDLIVILEAKDEQRVRAWLNEHDDLEEQPDLR